MNRRPLVALTASLLLVGLLAACGGSDETAVPEVDETTQGGGLVIDPDLWIPVAEAPVEAASPETADEDPADPAVEQEGEDGEAPEADPTLAACNALADVWNSANQAMVNLSFEHPRALVNAFQQAALIIATGEPLDGVVAPWNMFNNYLQRVSEGFEGVNRDDMNAVADALERSVTNDETQAASNAGAEITAFIAGGCPAP